MSQKKHFAYSCSVLAGAWEEGSNLVEFAALTPTAALATEPPKHHKPAPLENNVTRNGSPVRIHKIHLNVRDIFDKRYFNGFFSSLR